MKQLTLFGVSQKKQTIMTTEQKANAYDDALERAKKYCKGHHADVNPQAAMEYVFPELKESEDDEKMREKLLFLMEEENSIDSWDGCYQWLQNLKF